MSGAVLAVVTAGAAIAQQVTLKLEHLPRRKRAC